MAARYGGGADERQPGDHCQMDPAADQLERPPGRRWGCGGKGSRRWWKAGWRNNTPRWSGSPDLGQKIVAEVSLASLTMRVPVDRHGAALWRPEERTVLPTTAPGVRCAVCRELSTATGTALLWRRLGLVSEGGAPTLRGELVSFFAQGNGLAIAAALETHPTRSMN